MHRFSITETGLLCLARIERDAAHDSGLLLAGRPVEDKHLELVDDAGQPVAVGETGELIVRSPYIAEGYWRNPTRHGPGLRSRSRCARSADLSHRRPRAIPGRRPFRVSRTTRSPGQDPRLPRRAGGDRGHAHAARRGTRSGGDRERARAERQGAGGVRRARAGAGPDGRGAARLSPAAAGAVHDSRRVRVPAGTARDAHRQDRSPGAAPARGRAASDVDGRRAAELPRTAAGRRSGKRCSPSITSARATTSSTSAATRCSPRRCSPRWKHASGVRLPLATLFQAPTIEGLAAIIGQGRTSESWRSLVAIQPAGTRPPLFAVPGIGGNVVGYHDLSRLLGPDQPFYGLQSRGLSGTEPPRTEIEDMAAAYLAGDPPGAARGSLPSARRVHGGGGRLRDGATAPRRGTTGRSPRARSSRGRRSETARRRGPASARRERCDSSPSGSNAVSPRWRSSAAGSDSSICASGSRR